MIDARTVVMDRLVGLVARRDRSQPFRLGIDGRCGAGKTRFGLELADALTAAGEDVLRLDSDDFHHVAAVRRRQVDPARGYYEDAYDLRALRDDVLIPLGSGVRTVRAATCDMARDRRVEDRTVTVGPDTVVLLECTFIQRHDLRRHWDLLVHLDVSPAVSLDRAVRRDAEALGGADAARTAHERRYAAAWGLYEAAEHPRRRADVLVDHDDPHRPSVLRWPDEISR